MDRIRRVVAEEPLIRTGNFYAGNDPSDRAEKTVARFICA